MRAVVVGGMGFIGAEIVRELVQRGDGVVVLDRTGSQAHCDRVFGAQSGVIATRGDMLESRTLDAAFADADEVYHLAGKLGTSELDGAMQSAVEANITAALNVFEAAVRAGVPRLFFPTKPNVWLNTYTITKVAAEQFAQLYAGYHPIRITVLRYFNAYGPRQHLYPIRKIIPTFAAQALRGLPIQMFGDGAQTVDMVLSRDLARLTVEATRRGYTGPPLDCGRGVPMTVREVAEAVNDLLGNTAGVRCLPMRRGETPGAKLVADLEGLRNLLEISVEPRLVFPTFAPWRESLGETLDYYRWLDPHVIDAALAYYGITDVPAGG